MTNDKALEIWSVQTLCDTGILLSIVSFLLHIGRPYFERILGRLTLRVAADLWWLAYVALRDGSLFVAALFGFLTLNLDMMADIKIGLPFVPLGTVALACALYVKVFRNAEDFNRNYIVVTCWTALAALLNAVGFFMVMECPDADDYTYAQSGFWKVVDSWKSHGNPMFSTVTWYIAMPLLLLVVLMAFIKALKAFRTEAAKGSDHV